jgi:hypothetical protein
MLPHPLTPVLLALGPRQVRSLGLDVDLVARRRESVTRLGEGLLATFACCAPPDAASLPVLGRELGLAGGSASVPLSPGHAACLREACRM